MCAIHFDTSPQSIYDDTTKNSPTFTNTSQFKRWAEVIWKERQQGYTKRVKSATCTRSPYA